MSDQDPTHLNGSVYISFQVDPTNLPDLMTRIGSLITEIGNVSIDGTLETAINVPAIEPPVEKKPSVLRDLKLDQETLSLNLRSLGDTIRARREGAGLRTSDLAESVGTSQATITRTERGYREEPQRIYRVKAPLLLRIIEVLGIDRASALAAGGWEEIDLDEFNVPTIIPS